MTENMATPPRLQTLDAAALVIGVSDYARLPPLPPVADAQAMAAVLSDPALCAYPPERVLLLQDASATKAAILAALDRIAANARDSSTILLYFSGHGALVDDGTRCECYLMPVEATWRTPEMLAETAISGAELSAKLKTMRGARAITILDCCRAAGMVEPGASFGRQLSPRAIALLGRGRGRAVLAASQTTGLAYAGSDDEHSVFTRHVLAGMRGSANGTGGVIRICDLFHYVQQRMAAEQPDQQPVFKAELEENFPVALYRGGSAPAWVLPEASDFDYDGFVSYSRGAPEARWVEDSLVPRLEALGLRLSLPQRDFRLGMPRIREMERCVSTSRYTIGVLSPDYLAGPFEDFQSLIAQHLGLEQRDPCFLPVVVELCSVPLSVRMTELLDMTQPALRDATILRLAQRLREPRRPASH